jgi:hypothetical protein
MSRAASAPLACLPCLLALALLGGCAAPGDPTARHPVVPVEVKDLAARQSGPAVELSFTLPRESADREPLAEPPSIEIYRAALAPGTAPDRKTRWRLAYTIPQERVDTYAKGDRVEFRDPLTPEDLSRPAGAPLGYMVRTQASRQGASGDSNYITVRIYPAPQGPSGEQASVTENAIVLSWMDVAFPSDATPSGYRVYRAEVEPQQQGSAQNQPTPNLKSPLELLGTVSSHEYRDTQFEFGKTYLYTVRAVAQFGQDLVESADGPPAIVTPRDTFPPAAPVSLVAAVLPATPEAPAYVELSWSISQEGDLAGYRVYRGERDDTPGERMNTELLLSPTFRDISVMAGRGYFYRVSAVDRAGNESPLSSAVRAEVPQGTQ